MHRDLSETDVAVSRLLMLWADWMRGEVYGRGYPSASPGLSSGGASTSFDDLCDAADQVAACQVDAAISELGPAEQCAISCVLRVARVWRLRRPVEEVFAEAVQNLVPGLRRRGLM